MNLLHLKYAVEVEKTCSISKAAENLFMSQPNLSRAIKELEESLNITIFKRTSKGISPTPQGQEFLVYAKNIIAQVNAVEAIYKGEKDGKQKFAISVPRASYISAAFIEFVKEFKDSKQIEFYFKETNSMRAISNIINDNYNLAIIRYQTQFETYFNHILLDKGLESRTLNNFTYLLTVSQNSPILEYDEIVSSDLHGYIEIAHGDPYVPSMPIFDVKRLEWSDKVDKRIFVFERGSQFDLLSHVHETYMWCSKISDDLLNCYNLVQISSKVNQKEYKDVLIFRKEYRFTDLDNMFIEKLNLIKDR